MTCLRVSQSEARMPDGITWAVSSAGRASRLHREGRRFEPVTAHHVALDQKNDPSGPRELSRAFTFTI